MKLTGIAYPPAQPQELSVAGDGPGGYYDNTCTPGLPPHPIVADTPDPAQRRAAIKPPALNE